MGGLEDLHDSIPEWLQLSQTQQALCNQKHRKCIEELLDGSLRTLDVCGILQDVLSLTKGCIWELELSFRRKRGVDLGFADEVDSYVLSRRKMRKLVSKTLSSLERMEKQNILRKDSVEDAAALNFLREVEQINISVFESVLRFLSRLRTKSSGWSVVSMVMPSKRVSCQADVNEVEGLDVELLALKSSKINSLQVHGVMKRAEALELGIQETGEVLECIFRCLMKTRVSLLNIISN